MYLATNWFIGKINENAWQIKLDHQFESLQNFLTDRSAQFMNCWLAESTSCEATNKTDGLDNEGPHNRWEKKKQIKSNPSPEENVNKLELYI